MENSIEQFQSQQLAVISPLEQVSLELRAEAQGFNVDGDTIKDALELKKKINAHSKTVKDLRLEITRPIDQVKDAFISKEKEILSPLDEAKSTLGDKIIAYEEEQERLRQIEEQRIDGIVAQVEALYKPGMTENQVEAARASAKKLVAELPETDKKISRVNLAFLTLSNRLQERTNDLEVEKQRAAKKKLEDDAEKIEREKREIAAAKERQRLEQEQIDNEKAERAAEAAKPKTGIRVDTKFEITSPDEVDRLLCSPDPVKIRQAVKDGAKALAGIRIYEEKAVR